MKRTLINPVIYGWSIFVAGVLADTRPNIVLIMGDDIGYADIGCFGSEIDTPNLDRLGYGGMRFTQAYNMSKCNPTRSCMLTGTFWSGATAQSLGALMGQSGYTTLYSGKEHFDPWVPERLKAMDSFEHSFCHYGGAGPFFEYNAVKFYLNRDPIEIEEMELSGPYYKTTAITDYAIKFLEQTTHDESPFFLYVPYESAHYPIHAQKKDFNKFEGKYLKGWDAIRRARYEKQLNLKILEPGARLSPPEGDMRQDGKYYRPWSQLSKTEQEKQDTNMAGFAAMVHCLDRNVGRILDKIESMGELDNTLILFLSDNGSNVEDRNRTPDNLDPTHPESFFSLNPCWANVGNTPFRMFKKDGYEGGVKTHLIAFWPDVIKPGSIYREPVHIVDFMPTFLELANGEYPAISEGKPTPKLDGLSLLPVFKGEERESHKLLISGWGENQRMIRRGDWKIVRSADERNSWRLYNMEEDPSELNDLSQKMPEKVKSLVDLYDNWQADRLVGGFQDSDDTTRKMKLNPKARKKKQRKMDKES